MTNYYLRSTTAIAITTTSNSQMYAPKKVLGSSNGRTREVHILCYLDKLYGIVIVTLIVLVIFILVVIVIIVIIVLGIVI